MSFIILKNNLFINIIDLLKDLVEECLIIFNNDSIEIKTLDKNIVCLIDILLNDIYEECSLDNIKKITLKLSDFHTILSCKETNDTCKISFDDDYIKVIYTNKNNKKGNKYKLKLLYNVENELGEPEILTNIQLILDSKYLSSLCKKIKKFDESLRLTIENEDVMIKTGNNSIVELFLEKEDNKLKKVIINEPIDIDMKFLLSFLLLFSKAEKFTSDVLINIDDSQSPIELCYNFNNSYIKFYTPPQIED
jgi:proliferating cell nuclear antigen PCNA